MTTTQEKAGIVYLTDSATFTLLSPADLKSPIDSYQLITGSFPGQDEISFEAYMTADKEFITLSLFASTGQSIADLIYDGVSVTFSSAFIKNERFKSEYIIADIFLCFAKEEVLAPALEKTGLTLKVEKKNGMERRIILERGKEIVHISSFDNIIELTNDLRGYSYRIEVL